MILTNGLASLSFMFVLAGCKDRPDVPTWALSLKFSCHVYTYKDGTGRIEGFAGTPTKRAAPPCVRISSGRPWCTSLCPRQRTNVVLPDVSVHAFASHLPQSSGCGTMTCP